VEEQGLGWKNKYGKGNAEDTITSGLEGAWTSAPARWSHMYLSNLYLYDWELTKSPAGAWQWKPKDGAGEGTVPDAHVRGKSHAPMMFTTDLALKEDPIYGEISKRFFENPKEFQLAFAKAWYKLTHRDMGPYSRGLGSMVPEPQIWQDPIPSVDHELIGPRDISNLKGKILGSGVSNSQLVSTAWASASTFRGSDKRGGANGARIRLAPQKDWEVNQPAQLSNVLGTLEKIQQEFNSAQSGNKKASLADLIVLGGCAAIEDAAKKAGYNIQVPFTPGRTDASQEMTDVQSVAFLEPTTDGFRNYLGQDLDRSAPELLVDRAQLLTLTAPEMTVLIGGMRVLNTNIGDSQLGVFTERPGALSNDYFVNLLDMDTTWEKTDRENIYEGKDRSSDETKWTATSVDLVFGSNSQLRAIAEAYASADAQQKFVNDFVAVWDKVMNLDRF
jgi:catalase-peroxidase